MRVPNPSFSATTHWVKIGGESLHCVGKPCKTLLVFHLTMWCVFGSTKKQWSDTVTLNHAEECTRDSRSKFQCHIFQKGPWGWRFWTQRNPPSDLPFIAWHPLTVVPDITTDIVAVVATRIMAPKQCRKPKRSNCPSYPTIGTAGSVGRKMRTDESLELWSGVSLRAFEVVFNMFVLARSC